MRRHTCCSGVHFQCCIQQVMWDKLCVRWFCLTVAHGGIWMCVRQARLSRAIRWLRQAKCVLTCCFSSPWAYQDVAPSQIEERLHLSLCACRPWKHPRWSSVVPLTLTYYYVFGTLLNHFEPLFVICKMRINNASPVWWLWRVYVLMAWRVLQRVRRQQELLVYAPGLLLPKDSCSQGS